MPGIKLSEIPDNCTAVGTPARVVRRNGKKVDRLDHIHTPDPLSQEICTLKMKIERLEKQIKKMEEEKQ